MGAQSSKSSRFQMVSPFFNQMDSSCCNSCGSEEEEEAGNDHSDAEKLEDKWAECLESFPDQQPLLLRRRLRTAVFAEDESEDENDASHATRQFENELEWLSWAMGKIWPFARQAAEKAIKNNIEPKLKEKMPGPFKGIRFTDISLGDTPPKFGVVRYVPTSRSKMDNIGKILCSSTLDELGNGKVEIEIDIIWEPSNATINLLIPMGGGKTGLHLGIERLIFKGSVTFLFSPILDSMPIVAGLHLFMLSPPNIDWVFTGLGGKILEQPTIASIIRTVVEENISNVIVLPNQFYWHWVWGREMEIDVASHEYVRPIALVRLGVVEGRGLTAQDWALFGSATSDPYAVTSLGTQSNRTAHIKYSLNPKWGDAAFHDFLVFDRRELLYVKVFDYDYLSQDDFIGQITPQPLKTILRQNNEWWPLAKFNDDTMVTHGEVRIVAELYQIIACPTCLKHPPRQRGQAKSECLLIVQLRCLSGLSRADSAGVIVRLTADGKPPLESKPSEFVEPSDGCEDYIDPAVLRCVRFLRDEGYSIALIARGTGLHEESVRGILSSDTTETPFYARWHQNLHLLLDSVGHSVKVEAVLPGGDSSEIDLTFTSRQSLQPKKLILNSVGEKGIFSPEKLAIEKKLLLVPSSSSSSMSKTPSIRTLSSPLSRPLVLDVRLDLFGFSSAVTTL